MTKSDDMTAPEFTQKKKGDIAFFAYSSFEDVEHLREEWDTFMEAVDGDIFFSFDWCRIWWKYYGNKRELSIVILRKAGEIVGLFPLFTERIWTGFVRLRVLKMVGSDFTIAQFKLPVNAECLPEVMWKFADVLAQYRWDVCSLGPISGFFHTFDTLCQVFEHATAMGNRVVVKQCGVQTVFELTDSWDEYVMCLKKKERQLIRSNYKKIGAQRLNLMCRTAASEDCDREFEAFVVAHESQWRQVGRAGHFGDWPDSKDFHREMAAAQVKKGRLRLLRIQVADECFAYQYSYSFGQRYFEILMGRSAPDESDIDLGRLVFAEQAQRAIEHGIRNIDSMRGRYEYKLRLGGKLVPLLRVRIVRKGAVRNVCSLAAFLFSKLVDLVYYKLWYCKLAPRIGAIGGRPLWAAWIRISSI